MPLYRTGRSSIFLSTPSARRATQSGYCRIHRRQHFYPRPLRGGRPKGASAPRAIFYFYPRPLRGGRRQGANYWSVGATFLSTPSARRATPAGVLDLLKPTISIHALCEEGDICSASFALIAMDFYPRPLRGGRPLGIGTISPIELISIHALCEEGDLVSCCTRRGVMSFLSTPSARRATYTSASHWRDIDISIHALCEEGDGEKV